MSDSANDSDAIEEYIAIGEQVAADPRYQQLRAAMAHRIRTYARTLIHDPSISDDEYHRHTTSYDLEQVKLFLRETSFLYTEARETRAGTDYPGKPAATPTTRPDDAVTATSSSRAATAVAGSWSDGYYQHPSYVAARSAMATRIRTFDLSLVDDADVSDEQFHTRSGDFSYQQTRQLIIDTINTLGVANPLT